MRFTVLVLAWLIYYGLGDRVPNLPLLGQICLVMACFIGCGIDVTVAESPAKKAAGRLFSVERHSGN